LQSKYPHRLVVLGFPCNQFGYQVSAGNLISLEKELCLFAPNFTLFEKCDVNGTNTHPDPRFLVWSPINRTDISWNFEKFLIGPEGEPFKRYMPVQTLGSMQDLQVLYKATLRHPKSRM
uniref:Glutathione peroxidase n=1 Tax=Takifugu rubripes TaxID=31033 RepID=A0A674M9G1_TAKRU